MNSEVLPTTYLGRELPKEYINSIVKGETFPEWLTMFPHSMDDEATDDPFLNWFYEMTDE